ncbi:hypothetical protein JCGZ_13711 [Jatropha curcas]|uniref:Aminotransferase-like plant mobile domain-containing protein n=1 Tax=Jatropha curcas TaxID=180498 RepID=A0A067LDM9_JATCU|nr:hypothetical protein JCGZ_13711 [Jatropha curcas]
MRYALMERWNDCTHSFIFDFGEMTLTQGDFTAITGLGFDGEAVPLDSRYQMAALGAELVATLLAVTTCTRELPTDVRPAAPAYTREERDQAARSFTFYIISSQLLCTSQNKGDPAILACLQDLSLIGTYDRASLALAHLYHGLDVWTRGSDGMTPEDRLLEYGGFPADDYLVPGNYASYLSTRLKTRLPNVREHSQDRKRHRTPASYEAQAEVGAPTGPTSVMLGDIPFPLGMEVTLDPTLGLGPTLAILADLRQVLPQLQLDPEHATHELEIGRLRRHQSRQAAAVSRLQMENDRLRTRLEVEGIPLDFSDEEEGDDDDSSQVDGIEQTVASMSRKHGKDFALN